MIIKKNLNTLLSFLENKDRLNFYGIVILQFIGSLLEAFGIALILPILAVILGQQTSTFFFLNNIHEILNFSNKESLLILSIASMLLFFIFKNTILTLIYKKIFSFAYRIQYKIKSKIYTHFINQRYHKFTEKGSSKLISTVSVDLNIFTQNFLVAFLIFLTEIFVLLTISILLIIIEPSGFILVSFVTLIFVLVFMKLFKRKLNSLGEEKENFEEKMQKIINDSLNSFQITKIHNKENFFIDKFNLFNDKTSFLYGRFIFLQNIPRFFFEILVIILLTILVFTMIQFNYSYDEIFIKVAIFSAAAFRLMPSINRLTYTYQSIVFSTSTLDNLYRLNKEISSSIKEENLSEQSKNLEINFHNSLKMENILYKYEDKIILNNLNLEIKKGEAIGIYGMSGGGKTTLINLISGLTKPLKGNIFIDDKKIQIDNSSWQNLVGYVPQTTNLLDDTIINNITFCDENVDQIFLEKIGKQAQILDLIKNHGDKNVGERGLRMSGGQLQRVSIARALYKKPSILIFDEATNALDEATEQKVFDTVYSLKGKVTLIIVSHNLDNLKQCDKKFKLEEGNLNEIEN
ncbi:MAG: ATP-binding cassette domain-containing protein [Candidatus Pelagibacter sp.]